MQRHTTPFEVRVWHYVDKRGPDECWPWTAKSKTEGYGVIGAGGRKAGKILAHRAAWISENGHIEDNGTYHGTVVMHTCDKRLCCNPAHLRLGTQGENVKDMDAKGRRVVSTRSGEDHPLTTVTADDVRAIRASIASNPELAAVYGVTRQTIRNIRVRNTWGHVA